ncbi:MAG TPA: hypothetical protein VE987_17325, partial [Polyangiaceae bacterium]|nr:hypothetical protein [Polyangiaceae bacterium]
RFEAIVAAVRYEGDAGSLPAAPAGMTHRQASFVHLPVPRAWEWPETLRFLDPEWDSVAVRVSIAEPLVPEGTLALGVEAPGRLCIVSSSTQPVDDVGARGWTGDWRVERPGADAGVLVVRKACLRLDPDVVVTLYGKARADLLERLDPVWAAVRASLRARGAG